MPTIPEPMSRQQLAALLDDISARVKAGDSFEGYLNYTMPMDDWPEGQKPENWPSDDCDFWVHGAYRIGNTQGQGGLRLLGRM